MNTCECCEASVHLPRCGFRASMSCTASTAVWTLVPLVTSSSSTLSLSGHNRSNCLAPSPSACRQPATTVNPSLWACKAKENPSPESQPVINTIWRSEAGNMFFRRRRLHIAFTLKYKIQRAAAVPHPKTSFLSVGSENTDPMLPFLLMCRSTLKGYEILKLVRRLYRNVCACVCIYIYIFFFFNWECYIRGNCA